jgi:hypothetical protein
VRNDRKEQEEQGGDRRVVRIHVALAFVGRVPRGWSFACKREGLGQPRLTEPLRIFDLP